MIRFVIPAYNEAENIPNLMADLGAAGARARRAHDLRRRRLDRRHGRGDRGRTATDLHLAVVAPRGQPRPGHGDQLGPARRAGRVPGRRRDRHARGRQHLRPRRPAAHARAASTQGDDVVLASVYAPGGRIIGVAPWRLAASQGGVEHLPLRRWPAGDPHAVLAVPRLPRRHAAARPPRPTAACSCASPASRPTSSCCSSSTTPARRSPRCPRSTTGAARLGVSKMNLKPTVLAYGRLMAAHIVGRIQPPPLSPLGRDEPASAASAPADAAQAPAERRVERARAWWPPGRHRRGRDPRHGPGAAPAAGGRAGHRCSSAARRWAAWPAPSTSTATGSTASTTSSCPSDERMLVARRRARPAASTCASRRSASASSSDGEMHPFNGLADFARFPPLSPLGRARLAWFVAQCQLRTDYAGAGAHAARALAAPPLRRRGRTSASGARCWTRASTPTTTSCPPPTCGRAPTACAPRARAQGAGETMGCLRGGHERLIEAAGDARRELGVDFRLDAGVEGLVWRGRRGARRDGRRRGRALRPDDRRRCSRRRCAACCPSDAGDRLLDAYPQRYLGVVCLILKLQPLADCPTTRSTSATRRR